MESFAVPGAMTMAWFNPFVIALGRSGNNSSVNGSEGCVSRGRIERSGPFAARF